MIYKCINLFKIKIPIFYYKTTNLIKYHCNLKQEDLSYIDLNSKEDR